MLYPVIDLSKKFMDVCYHSKVENALFPALEKAKMPQNMGPIAMMLLDQEHSRNITNHLEDSAKEYIESKNSKNLINYMYQYVEHITEHLWKKITDCL